MVIRYTFSMYLDAFLEIFMAYILKTFIDVLVNNVLITRSNKNNTNIIILVSTLRLN